MEWLMWWFVYGVVGLWIGCIVDYVFFDKSWEQQKWTFWFVVYMICAGFATLVVAMCSLFEGVWLKWKGK